MQTTIVSAKAGDPDKAGPRMVKKLFPGVGMDLADVIPEMTWANVEVTGMGPPAKNALKRGGWDGKTPIASVMVSCQQGVVVGAEWLLRGTLAEVSVPMRRLSGDNKMSLTLDLTDLSVFKFPTVTNPGSGAPNHSNWANGEDYTTSLTVGGTVLSESSAIKGSDFMKNTGFSLR